MNKELLRIAFADDDQDDHLFFFSAVKEIYELALINNFFSSGDVLDFYQRERHVTPHIFFLDLNMPGNEKLECLLTIKKDTVLSKIPVVIYSTSASDADIELAMSYGAAAFITKPVSMEDTVRLLRETIEQYVGIKFREKVTKVAG